jgi:putative membrane-bound dehydrogenase-like protein
MNALLSKNSSPLLTHPATRAAGVTFLVVLTILSQALATIRAHAAAAEMIAADEPAQPPALSSQPQTPADALKTFELPDGFRIELIAAEPLVQDPVAIEWGADGKLWVAEMADYPNGLDGKMSPGGRVRFLEDADGDGKPEHSTIFLDEINFPTGVLPWRKGVLVTAAPQILYAEDTDGDGKADVREPLFTGFKEGNPQLRVNGLQWGLDGWVYCANGWSSGEVKSVKTGKVVDLNRLDFRFQPDTGELELISGITEFGRNRDDWGNWFGCDNTNVAWHFVLEERYLRRNPHYSAPDPRKQFLPPAPRVFARSQLQKRYHTFEHADRYTSACAATPYRDELLFADGARHMFVCEPMHNLVQHLVLSEQGASFTAAVPEHKAGRDFLTSSDQWFRPVNLRTGPDGALWVVDMYRYMIEHPEWLPDEGKRDFEPYYRAGEDRGRIYRVYHKQRPPRRLQQLAEADTLTLCGALASPNGWQRDIAQQQLQWRQPDRAAGQVAKVFASGKTAKARLQAMYTLANLGALEEQTITAALRDAHPMVRRGAVRLAEDRLDQDAVLSEVCRLAEDGHAAVRLQAAFTLGQSQHKSAGEALARALASARTDQYLTAAVFCSLRRDNLAPSFQTAIDQVKHDAATARTALELVGLATAMGRDDVVLKLLAEMPIAETGYQPWQVDAVDRWLRSRKSGKKATDAASSDNSSDSTASDDLRKQAQGRIEHLLNWSRRRALDPAADARLRSACIRLAARNAPSRDAALELAEKALTPQTPDEVQRIAAQEVAALGTIDAAGMLLDRWTTFGPGVRQEVLSALLARPTMSEALLARIEQGQVGAGEIDTASRQRLLNSRGDALRRRARLVFGDAANDDRRAVVREYQDIASLTADAARGRDLFMQKCVACHVAEGRGHAVGPDLMSLSDRSIPGLLTAILDPSRAVEPKYAVYQVTTADGRLYAGVLAAETAAQIELVEQENRRHAIPRSDIEELASSAKSLMPDGFEKEVSRQQLADLIGYLQSPQAAAR